MAMSTGWAVWILALWISLGVVKAQKPQHTVSSFTNLPARLFFFDDTTSVVYHDSLQQNLYVSQDEGKSWKIVDGIPQKVIVGVYEHPFHTRVAFALTDGTTHYRTEDRGKTWQPFDVPAQPALVARPLSFHSDPKKSGYILYQGSTCSGPGGGWTSVCKDTTYYTKDSFSDDTQELLEDTTRCVFAHSSKEFLHDAPSDLIYCVGWSKSSTTGSHRLEDSRLYSSSDFFKNKKVEDLGLGKGKDARGVVAFAIVSKYAVVALKDLSTSPKTSPGGGEMHLYVTLDSKTWAKAHFPHASSATLRENAYTILESTTHSLGVDVVLQDKSAIGTLFLSNSNGTYFVESLKDTNRNELGFVDYERLYGLEGVGLANTVSNAQEVEGRGAKKRLRSQITFDDGRHWQPLRAPVRDVDGKKIECDDDDDDEGGCALHLHSVTNPNNFGRIFSSPAPGFAMGVGSVGSYLRSYNDGDTYLSTDGGLSWKQIAEGPTKWEFGDQGSLLVVVDDDEWTDEVKWSSDLGKTWKTYDFGIKIRAKGLITLPDSTSQKFLLLGQVNTKKGKGKSSEGPVVIVYLDFANTRGKKCEKDDFEKWYARPPGKRECLMGHKQWYMRRKPDAACFVGEKFKDPEGHEEDCECTEADFECDYNFVRNGNKCDPVGPEPIPAGVCSGNDPKQKYWGSSGYRRIPGNTCKGGVKLDEKVEKFCDKARPAEGSITHQQFLFSQSIAQFAYFESSSTILVRLLDHTIWQSSNEGYTWTQLHPEETFLAFYHHKFSNERAYLITSSKRVYYTTDTGRSWNRFDAPTVPNTFDGRVMRFSPSKTDFIIWVGNVDCASRGSRTCHAEAHFSRNNGRSWSLIEKYVRNCAFAQDKQLSADPTEIICESVQDKSGMQIPGTRMELVAGSNYFQSKKRTIFDSVVGFAKFSEFLVVAEMKAQTKTLDLQVSLDGRHFSPAQFPPTMSPDSHAYTVLESSTKALFVHMTMTKNPPPAPQWGNILKSNSNGTYFGTSVEHVNRNDRGYVDFEKMIGLDGIAIVNIVSNPDDATLSGKKKLQTRITHNDGSTWRRVTPPLVDSLGEKYECSGTKCALHLHGYTARRDPRATYSSPSAPGLILGVGNVGEHLLPYVDSDTFLSRDGGFTWEEVRKDAHLWEYGDYGSLIVIVNDEEPVNALLYTTDEGLNWREYQFSQEKVRVVAVTNVPSDTSRKFLLLANTAKERGSVAIHVDFSALTSTQCLLDAQNPANDDFELWSPSEDRVEQCLFGRQTLYHRRIRDRQCYVGKLPKLEAKIQKNCTCTKADFECEFNYVKNERDECVLVPNTGPLPDDDSCANGAEYWYERTPYRIIPYSSCEGGIRPDRGRRHACPGLVVKSGWFWTVMLVVPFGFTALVGYWYYRRSGKARGTIRLPGGADRYSADSWRSGSDGFGRGGVLDTIASVPWFLVGLAGIAMEWVSSRVDDVSPAWRSRRGYRDVPVDEDAQILRFEDEEQHA